jgi:hypothetical protein
MWQLACLAHAEKQHEHSAKLLGKIDALRQEMGSPSRLVIGRNTTLRLKTHDEHWEKTFFQRPLDTRTRRSA